VEGSRTPEAYRLRPSTPLLTAPNLHPTTGQKGLGWHRLQGNAPQHTMGFNPRPFCPVGYQNLPQASSPDENSVAMVIRGLAVAFGRPTLPTFERTAGNVLEVPELTATLGALDNGLDGLGHGQILLSYEVTHFYHEESPDVKGFGRNRRNRTGARADRIQCTSAQPRGPGCPNLREG
jgi:hypothetical protein